MCEELLKTFFTAKSPKLTKSVASDVKDALTELFTVLSIDNLLIENELKVTTSSFINDFLKMSDEIKSDQDIVDIWHIDKAIATQLYMLFYEVVFKSFDAPLVSDSESEDSDPDVLDQSSDSE